MMGPGAMGSLFGGLLTHVGEELWLVGYLKEQTDTICSVGLTNKPIRFVRSASPLKRKERRRSSR